ncbi:PREDICTED: uncharacterized protein LOC108562130 [Nicrophorus vespilloides]|uniref:Uncharacterized protein LOC108562130 n=1 Tax=Nicrophorus vespilloides TaxID=110193 RepID=A0ABM1MMM7_NICVS|nr:PREDICTED: uncharacterized protein LOC108562130 [Nicrophorus vespilloides]
MRWTIVSFLFGCVLSLALAQLNPDNFRHRAVLQSASHEAQLPPNLLNPFYKDPRIRQALARSSWFGPGENVVFDREAEKINRREIFLVLKHAGLLPQQQ